MRLDVFAYLLSLIMLAPISYGWAQEIRYVLNTIIGAGLYTPAKANRLIEALDYAAAFKQYHVNPDLPERFACVQN